MCMTETLNYREFYQKTPFHICDNDRASIQKEAKFADVINDCTHWLMALEGNEAKLGNVQWRVVVFPSSESGRFNYRLAFFKSPFMLTFNEAYEHLQKIEAMARHDQLFSIYENK